MIICPECSQGLATEGDVLACKTCSWHGETREGVPIYLGKRDLADAVLREYLDNYDRIASDDIAESILDERYLQYQASNLAQRVGRLEGKRVCDVGCGKGFLARALLAVGARELTVVDIAVSYLQRLEEKHRLRPVIANAENLPFRGEFDVVVTTDVMEHVLNVGSFLYSLNRALKLGGRAYVRVPLRESLLGYSPFLGCPYRLVHLRSFDKSILRTYLSEAGFQVERFYRDGFWLNIPRPGWTRGYRRRQVLEWFVEWAKQRLKDPIEITRWSPRLVGIFLRPVEITVVARKMRSLETAPAG
jgi:SAM-dependent methyltransferase